MNEPLFLPVLFPVLCGLIILTIPQRLRRIGALAAAILELGVCVLVFVQSWHAPVSLSLGGWDAPVGIMLYIDRFGAVMLLLTSFIFLMLFVFEYDEPGANRLFYMLFLVLEGLICGLILLDDLFSIFVLIEVSAIVVSLLIMFRKDGRAMYNGLVYLLINIFSATFMLLGLAMLYRQTGTVSMRLLSDILGSLTDLRMFYLPYALIMTAICLKAAIMPLFLWLPMAHGTPSSPPVVSAVLSGLYVKSGIYLFIRCSAAFSAIDMHGFFLIAGAVTALVGLVFAIAQSDIKLILSYHTVSQIGLIMVALNMGNETAMWGGMYHIINHAVFKTVLFLGAGEIIARYKTRNIYEIKGVAKRMPLLTAAMVMAILGNTGAPLFNGSISKYLISLSGDMLSHIELITISLGTIVSFVKFSGIFFGESQATDIQPLSPNRGAVSVIFGSLCLVLGVAASPIIKLLFGVAVHVEAREYMIKSIEYFVYIAGAMCIYRLLVKGRSGWKKIRAVNIGFNGIAMSVVGFFVVITGYLFLR